MIKEHFGYEYDKRGVLIKKDNESKLVDLTFELAKLSLTTEEIYFLYSGINNITDIINMRIAQIYNLANDNYGIKINELKNINIKIINGNNGIKEKIINPLFTLKNEINIKHLEDAKYLENNINDVLVLIKKQDIINNNYKKYKKIMAKIKSESVAYDFK